MLTCKVGEKIINCFDNTYDKYQLKKWSDKNILICPDCNKPYEYCHGRVIPPYFRHKEKNIECEGVYSESETREHIDGKLFLYDWLLNLQKQGIICNVKLEGYIPDTKQRPDLYFECEGKRNVIEFQCTPIATEYMERHELYRLANVNDIWILGIDKYNFDISDNRYIFHNQYYKTIEKHTNYHLNINTKEIYIKPICIMPYLKYKKLHLKEYNAFALEYLSISQNNLILNNSIIKEFMIQDQKIYEENIERYKEEEKQIEIRKVITNERKSLVEESNNKYPYLKFTYRNGFSPYYLWGIDLSCSDDSEYTYFIKDNCIDYCSKYYGWKGKPSYSNKDSFTGDINNKTIIEFISKQADSLSFSLKIKEEKKNSLLDIFDKNIKIITNDYIVPKDIRFRCLRECDFKNDEYILDVFANEIRKLKTNKDLTFMICDGNIKDITSLIQLLKYHGFTSVNRLADCQPKYKNIF